jgi:hypothetical protein
VYSRSLLVALGAAYLVFACGESATDPSGVPEPPTLLSITGRANGTGPDGGTVDCVLDLTMELRTETFRDSNVVEYAGVHGGHVGRSVVDSTGAGMAFFADVYWPETMARFSQDSVELILGPDDPTEWTSRREGGSIPRLPRRGIGGSSSGRRRDSRIRGCFPRLGTGVVPVGVHHD